MLHTENTGHFGLGVEEHGLLSAHIHAHNVPSVHWPKGQVEGLESAIREIPNVERAIPACGNETILRVSVLQVRDFGLRTEMADLRSGH